MSEQTVKVYELAKELGINSISLVDKLKSLNINVKNHMSDLTIQEAQMARNSLDPNAAKAAESPAKKAVTKTRKKAPAEPKTDAATAPAGATAAGPALSPDAAAAATAAAAGSKSSAIIRRRVKADGATETVSQPASITKPIESAEAHEAEYQQHEEVAHYEQEAAPQQEIVEPAAPEAPAVEVAAPEAPPAPVETPAATTARPASPITPVGATPAAPSSSPIRPVGSPPVAPVAAPPRRSILKIVQPDVPAPRPIIKPAPQPASARPAGLKGGTSTQDKDGFRIIKMTKENLDQMAEEEAAKKRGGGGPRENEIRPEDVRFADYRKKEMVFLPKKKRIPVGKQTKRTEITQMKAEKRVVEMDNTITVAELASQLSVKASDVIRKLMAMGTMATMNQSLDLDTATVIAGEYKYEVKNIAFKEEEALSAPTAEDAVETLKPRPPVVTIMGHVDHGKTTLLDSIRSANVAAGETGGITQHIGAYTVESGGKLITFIDTPGHEAFTVMRARGANVTDIVILVVSADDGVMPQTREALSHAQAAKVPIIVAMNKIDKPGANPEKIKQALAELNLLAEDWGGETMFVPVSALKKTNIDKLLESILLQAEVLDLKANPDAFASGTVLEAKLEKGRGPVVSLLVSRGTLKVGDPVVSGQFAGRVKSMVDDKGARVSEVTPGMAAEIQGFEGVPNAGDKFNSTKTEADAREVAQHRIDQARAKVAGGAGKVSLEELFSKIQAGEAKELNVILKADVFGSVEAVRDSLVKLSTEKVKVKPILAAPGGITESDVLLATASGAIILGFNVRPETKARQLAEAEHVEIKTYGIIYELIDDVKQAMTGLLDKKKVERFLGRAEVRQTFSVPKIGTIAGSAVIDGKILRGANVRLLRDSRIIFDGKMSSLKRFKDDAKEVAQGFECGIGIENYNDLKPGDIIEAYQIDLVAPTLDQA